MGDEIKRDGDGALMKNADGVLINACAASPCAACGGATLLTIEVTFAGVNAAVCVGCQDSGGAWGDGGSFDVTGFSLDGTWTAIQTANPCFWSKSGFGSWGVDVYSDDSCNTFDQSLSGNWGLQVYFYNFGTPIWEVIVRNAFSSDEAAAFWTISNYATGYCDEVSSSGSNDLACGWTGIGRNNLSNGGTVVITPIF